VSEDIATHQLLPQSARCNCYPCSYKCKSERFWNHWRSSLECSIFSLLHVDTV